MHRVGMDADQNRVHFYRKSHLIDLTVPFCDYSMIASSSLLVNTFLGAISISLIRLVAVGGPELGNINGKSSADSIFTKEKRWPSSSLYSLCLTVGSVFGSNPHADPHLLD